ncbi:hypothetical protein JCM9279_000239 [Rhodotorula babjevae]
MHKLALLLGAVAWAHFARALPSSSSTSTSDSLAALFSAHGHWVDANNSSVVWTPSDAQSSTFRRQEHRWLPDALSSSSTSESPGLARLARNDVLDCLAGETVTIWGDSTARVLYYGLINKLEPTAVTDKHANRVLTFSPPSPHDNRTASLAQPRGTATFEFRWDPVLGSNSYSSFRPFLSTGRLPPLLSPSSPSSPSPPPSRTARPPALLLFSLGLWYIDPRPGMYPLARLAQYQSDVRALLGLAARLRVARTALVIAEVERPVESKDEGGRWHPLGEVDEANRWLRGEVRRWSKEEGARARTRVVVGASLSPFLPLDLAPSTDAPCARPAGSVFNAMIAHLSANTRDGLHYDLALAEEMADVVLHAVCAPAAAGPGAGAHEGLNWRFEL